MTKCGVVLKVVELVFGSVTDISCIRSYDDNLDSLYKSLSDLCTKKDDMIGKIKEGEDRLENISREAAIWLQNVRRLSEDYELKSIVNKDLQAARFVVKLMDMEDLKMTLVKEKKTQKIVVKLMKRLKEEMDDCNEDTKKRAKLEYMHLFKVVVELMNGIIDGFKNSMKKDMKMAIIVTNTLSYIDLQKFIRGDGEMERIMCEALRRDDYKLWFKHEDADLEKTIVKDVATKLLKPVRYLVTHFGKWINDASFRNVDVEANTEAEAVKLALDVIDGFLIKTSGLNVHKILRCKDYYHADRYDISKRAQKMANFIQSTILCRYPYDRVTNVIKNLESRDRLVFDVLEKLKDDHVDVVGIFGMAGIGKTTLAKEVYKRAKDMFSRKLMVEVSDTPNIVSIQAVIAESIGLSLDDIENVAQRATRLYNRLKSEKEKILVILDNIWYKINLDEIGIPRTCKLLLTTRERDVCRVMGARGADILKVSVLDENESRDLLNIRTRNQVNRSEYIDVVERLLSKCGGLPLAIVTIANFLDDKEDVAIWEKFADDLENPKYDFWDTFSIMDTSYKSIKVPEKRMFFLLACLFPLGSGISIESLTRYGIGLGLFSRVDNVSEAMEVANKWADELISSSMFIEGDVEGEVKIHSIMRAFAISFGAVGL